jgi:Xaa-Pro aminopeptidase
MSILLDPERASSHLSSRGLDVLVGAGYVNYGYITGYFTHFNRDYPGPLYNGLPLIRFAGLPTDRAIPPFLVTYPGEEGDILTQGTWIEDRRFWGPSYNVPGRPDAVKVLDDPVKALFDALDERGLTTGTIGISARDLDPALWQQVQAALPDANVVDASDAFDEIRMIKTAEEISRLRGAVAGVERGHAAVRESLSEGMTALQLAAIVNRAVIDEYTDRYIVHVSAGARGSVVLAPTEAQLKRGELISVDAGSLHRNYAGDMFRVYAFGEQPGDGLQVHAAMDEVNDLMIAAVKPGAVASELYQLGKAEMGRRGLQLALDFAGHGIGIDVHERPYLVANDHTVLQPGMVVVLEISTRRFDLGHLSAEITCLVTESGCEVLNSVPHTITHIP